MNDDRSRNGTRSNLSSSGSRRVIWIILILLLGLLMVATTVMALDGPETVTNPDAADSFDSAEALQSLRGILAVSAINVPIEYTDQGCIEEYDNKFGKEHNGPLTCSANDSSIGQAEVIGKPVCTSYNSPVTVTFIVTNTATAQSRYDVGYYFATDGDPNTDGARTGECATAKLTIPPGENKEPDQTSNFCVLTDGATATPDTDFVPCTTDAQCLAQTLQPLKNHCEPSISLPDTCGDMTQGVHYPTEFTVVAKCVDHDQDGYLDLPYCTSYDNQASKLCRSSLGATPNTKSKCGCNPGFNIPVIVPPDIWITKTAAITEAAPGDEFIYVIGYGSTTNSGQALTNVVISDTLEPDLGLRIITNTAITTSCTVNGNPVLADGNPIPGAPVYNADILCNVPDLKPGDSHILQFGVTVSPTATVRKVIPNTACVGGDETITLDGVPPEHLEVCDSYDITTPVTVSYFEAEATAGGTSFEWETATETGNAGFNIYVETPDGLQKVNDDLILSKVVDSLSPQQYSFEAAGVSGETFYIADVSLEDKSGMNGPFTVGEKHGERSELELIDWASVHIENDALTAQQAAANKAAVNGHALPGSSMDAVFQPEMTAAAAVVYPMVDLKVKADGIYRVTYEDVAAVVGNSLNGAPVTQLALTNKGRVVPIYLSGRGGFGRGDYFDFYGEGLDTLYTDSNIYVLRVHDGLAQRVALDNTRPARTAQPAEFYMETVEVENNVNYSYRSSNGDPWYDKVLYTKSGTNFDRYVTVDNYVAAAPSTLAVEIWGVSDRIDGDDHHVQVALNGAPAIDSLFDFNEVMDVTAEVAAADVKNGSNTLTFNFPNDQGADYDMAALEGYSLSYPRAFVARDGQLDFEASDDLFSVDGLDSRRVVVYRLGGDELTRVGRIKVRKVGSDYTAKFNGSGANDAYFVSTVAAMPAPEMALAGPMWDINSGSAELLIISHPNFISGLQPLVAQRQSEGLSVKVVDVQQIYKQYNGGVFDPYAIQDYIEHAMARMGTRYVLLVGGDTRDYRNYTGSDSISFVPTLYAKTSELIHVAPVDPLFTDVTGDGVPDAAVGRFPVHTVAELTAVVDKTLTYHARTDRTSAIFAADTGFEEDSDSLIPTNWSVEKTYISEGFEEARANLLEQMNAGVPLANFIGHSDTFFWSFDRLFEAKDAVALTNDGKPMVVTQWGCFNTYFVGEAYKTMGDNLLLAGSNGAAAVTGATTITEKRSEQKLGALMMPRLMAPGARIGDAMQDAKAELNKKHPKMVDVLLGWTILGDPTLVVTPDVR